MQSHQKTIDDLLEEVAAREECSINDIEWISWPQLFPTTAGPKGGIGGNMITQHQVHAFRTPNGKMFRFCSGVWRRWNGEFMQRW